MSFQTYTEEQAKANSRTLLPKGIYPFTVHAAFDKTKEGAPLVSSKGNAMIAVKLHVHREDGGVQFVDCYITDSPRMAWFSRRCAQTTGTLGQYEAGQWGAAELEGKQGFVALDIEAGRTKDANNPDGEKWPDKNVVKDWGEAIVRASGNAPAFTPPAAARKPEPTPAQAANQTGAASSEEVPFSPLRDFAQ